MSLLTLASLSYITVPEIFNRLLLPAHSSATSSPLCKLATSANVLRSSNPMSSSSAVLSVLITDGDLYRRSDLMFTMEEEGEGEEKKKEKKEKKKEEEKKKKFSVNFLQAN